jgi:quercetin dioxygenase-like cupin family protein
MVELGGAARLDLAARPCRYRGVLRCTVLGQMNDATSDGPRGFIASPQRGVTLRNPAGGDLTFLARGEGTAGSVTVFESSAAPGEGPPLHLHANEDELLYVLEGRLRMELDGAIEEATAGSLVFIPRGLPHTWQNPGPDVMRFLIVFSPAATGMEQFFESAASLEDDVPIADVFGKLGRAAGMEVLGPPLAVREARESG